LAITEGESDVAKLEGKTLMDLFAFVHKKKPLSVLRDREVLALAIQSEEEDARIYREFADRLQASYPASSDVFRKMAEEESKHRRRLLDIFAERFGEHLPLIRREDVRGFIRRPPVWMSQSFDIDAVRDRVEAMEVEARKFYETAAARSPDPAVRKLLVIFLRPRPDTKPLQSVLKPGFRPILSVKKRRRLVGCSSFRLSNPR
jgi:rubrerythrin